MIAQNPTDPIWGLYTSGVGERLKPGMDPCWITYTVGLISDPKIQINVRDGLMGVILNGVNWYEATEGQRRFSRYFDDRPDGIYKLTPCEVALPNLNGSWVSPGRGRLNLNQSGDKISGSASAVNEGDHFGQGHRNGGSTVGRIERDGTIVLGHSWGDGTFSEDIMRLSEDGRTMSGGWTWYTDSSKTTVKDSGTYSFQRN